MGRHVPALNQLLIWIALALTGYGVLVYAAGKTLYYPMRYPAGDWSAQSALGAEDVWITAADGVKLHAWWIARPGARLATLHLHGNAGNITYRDQAAAAITEAGSSVLLLDYRGYGKSEGRPWEAGLYRDAMAAYEWLLGKGYTSDGIVLHGESLGSAVAVELASHKRCAGVVLEAPFTSARAVAHRVVPFLGALVMWGYDSKSRMASVSAPVFIIHGTVDEVIAVDFGKELFAAAREPKRMWIIEGAGHNDLHHAGRLAFVKRLAGFYSSL
jgi:uncharacterized protein